MNYLLPPLNMPNAGCVSLPGYDQVDRSSDGIFRVESDQHASALIQRLGFRRASDERAAKASTGQMIGKAKVDDGDEDDFDSMTKDDLKSWLDERGVDYDRNAKKPELLELAENYEPASDEDEEDDEEDED